MRTRVARWGHSLAVRLPRNIAAAANLTEGTTVDITVEGSTVHIARAQPSYSLAELLAAVTPENLPDISDCVHQGQEFL